MIVGKYCQALASEISRYASGRNGWTSAILGYSTPGLLDELLAVGRFRSEGILAEDSFEQLRTRVIDAVKKDPGLGGTKERGRILGALPMPGKGRSTPAGRFVASSYASKAIASVVASIRDNYLSNWVAEFNQIDYQNDTGGAAVRPEEAGARLAAFILDVGISHDYLARWLTYRIKHSPREMDLVAFITDLADLYAHGRGLAEIVVVITAPTTSAIQHGKGWLTGKQTKAWLEANGATPPDKVHGGILFASEEWDIYGAVRRVSQAVERLKFRAMAKTGQVPAFHDRVWIKGVARPQQLRGSTGFAKALPAYEFMSPTLEVPQSENRLEVAVEFLASAADSVAATAVGMSWAALESLFASPGDDQRGVEVAKRATDVALVAYVRSQIYDCIGVVRGHLKHDPLAVELRALNGIDGIRRMVRVLAADEYLGMPMNRVRTDLSHASFLVSPDGLICRREQIKAILLDLYRQRNVTLHGGITDPPLLNATLREAGPIVLAVINRYASRTRSAPHVVDPLVFAFEATMTVERAIAGEPLEIFFSG